MSNTSPSFGRYLLKTAEPELYSLTVRENMGQRVYNPDTGLRQQYKVPRYPFDHPVVCPGIGESLFQHEIGGMGYRGSVRNWLARRPIDKAKHPKLPTPLALI